MAAGEEFRQGIEHLDLFVERGMETVPDDNQYHVRLGDQILFSSRKKDVALDRYRTVRDELLASTDFESIAIDPREALRKHLAQREVDLVRSKSNVRSKLRVPSRRGHR